MGLQEKTPGLSYSQAEHFLTRWQRHLKVEKVKHLYNLTIKCNCSLLTKHLNQRPFNAEQNLLRKLTNYLKNFNCKTEVVYIHESHFILYHPVSEQTFGWWLRPSWILNWLSLQVSFTILRQSKLTFLASFVHYFEAVFHILVLHFMMAEVKFVEQQFIWTAFIFAYSTSYMMSSFICMVIL